MLTSQQPSANWFEKKSGARKFFSAGMSRASGCSWRQDSGDELSRVRMFCFATQGIYEIELLLLHACF